MSLLYFPFFLFYIVIKLIISESKEKNLNEHNFMIKIMKLITPLINKIFNLSVFNLKKNTHK